MGKTVRSQPSGNMAMMWFFWVLGLFYIQHTIANEVLPRASACERQNLDISCEAGKVLRIVWATYGRLDGRTNRGKQGIHERNCRASKSLEVVKNRCQSKRSCFINAGNSVFGDPCYGVKKYLEVHYQCREVQQQASACEHHRLDISCEAGKVLRIDWATYGRLDGRTNCGKQGIHKRNCRASKSLEIVKNRCQSKRTCSINAWNSVFGDPCYGVKKYLEVYYQCISSEDTFKCGKKGKTQLMRIVGGTETQVNEFPWFVGIGFRSGAYKGCGGTLIAAEWVLSAAHCFTMQGPSDYTSLNGRPSDYTAIIGGHERTNLNEPNRIAVPVEKIIRYEDYDLSDKPKHAQNDIALLKLSHKVDLNKYTPACLPTNGASFDGSTATAVGWGLTSYQDDSASLASKLLKINLPVMSKDECKEFVTYDHVVCAGGQQGKGIYRGDSGGPLTQADPTTGQHTIIGIAHGWDFRGYGVFADVAYHRAWMDKQFSRNGGASFTP